MSLEPLSVCKGRVMVVNKSNWTCTVLSEHIGPVEDVPIAPIYIGEAGNGMYYLPEIGSTVWLAHVDQAGWFILMGAPISVDGDDTEVRDNDTSMGRHEADPGDIVLSGKLGSNLTVRKSGIIEIGASPIAKRFYIPLQNFIRDFCKSYEMISAGGNISIRTNDSDATFGTITESVVSDPTSPDGIEDITIAKTPTKLEMRIKEFAQDKEPVIELQMGRVELDSNDPLVGGLDWKDIIFELLVQNPESNPEDQDGEKKGGTVRILMDKTGTMNSCFFGSRFTKVHGTETLMAQNYVRQVEGMDALLTQSRSVEVYQNDVLTVNGLAQRFFKGGLDINIQGKITTNIEAPIEVTTGAKKENINGKYLQSVLGGIGLDATKDYQLGAGGSIKQVSGGAIEIIASNKISPKPTGMLLKTMGGKVKITSFPGNGPVPYATGVEIATAGGVIICDDTGELYMRNLKTMSNIQVSVTGVQLSTPGGAIGLGLSGEVQLGGVAQAGGAGNGNVITTLTHPFCYVTGLPIKGSDTVSAFSKNPIGAPGPNIPITPYIDVMAAAEAAIAAANTADLVL